MIEATQLRQAPARPAYVDRLVVLDDDPTGVQTLAGIRVLLVWDDPGRIARALAGRNSVHLITNTRALEPDEARTTVAAAARASLGAVSGARLLLRGDSTLRAHLLEEYLGLCDALGRGRPPLLLVPALPSAGRVTREGVHLIERGGRAEPLHETEYAGDGVFAYSTARLLEWAEERSDGLFRASAGESCTSTSCGWAEPTRWPPPSSTSRVQADRRSSPPMPRRKRIWRRSRPATRKPCGTQRRS
jgi:hypothetical protein